MNIAELRRLEAEATPGVWEVTEAEPNDGTSLVVGGKVSDLRLIADCQIRQDAALIVAMRNALPELLRKAEAFDRIVAQGGEPHGGVDVG